MELTPRQVQAMWLSYNFGVRKRIEVNQALVMQAAQADEKTFKEWMAT